MKTCNQCAMPNLNGIHTCERGPRAPKQELPNRIGEAIAQLFPVVQALGVELALDKNRREIAERRDRFAMAALTGKLISNTNPTVDFPLDAQFAYAMADAMLAARDVKP